MVENRIALLNYGKKNMNIIEARKRCDELRNKLDIIREYYGFNGYARYIGEEKSKPLKDELDKLLLAIIKAEEETEIKLK